MKDIKQMFFRTVIISQCSDYATREQKTYVTRSLKYIYSSGEKQRIHARCYHTIKASISSSTFPFIFYWLADHGSKEGKGLFSGIL